MKKPTNSDYYISYRMNLLYYRLCFFWHCKGTAKIGIFQESPPNPSPLVAPDADFSDKTDDENGI